MRTKKRKKNKGHKGNKGKNYTLGSKNGRETIVPY